MALEVGCIGAGVLWIDGLGMLISVDVLGLTFHGSSMLSGVWYTINNQSRTGTDKGNLTV